LNGNKTNEQNSNTKNLAVLDEFQSIHLGEAERISNENSNVSQMWESLMLMYGFTAFMKMIKEMYSGNSSIDEMYERLKQQQEDLKWENMMTDIIRVIKDEFESVYTKIYSLENSLNQAQRDVSGIPNMSRNKPDINL
jgi:uncharacterized protein YukE